MRIDVAALVGQHCITAEDGETLHKRVFAALENGEKVDLDFVGATVCASPFFNAMVGTLTSKYSPEDLNARLTFANLAPDSIALLRRVIKNSREYFADLKVRQAVDESNAPTPEQSDRHRM